MSAVEDIRIKLENRLNELEQEIESLRCALTALDDEQASAPGRADRRSERADRRRGVPARDPVASTSAAARAGPRRRGAAAAGQSPEDGADGTSSAELERCWPRPVA